MSSVREFGAKGDGKADDTQALQHAFEKGDGQVTLPRGEYLITRPLLVPLEKFGPVSISGSGGTARVIMAGAGPAFHIVGTHKKSALPEHFVDAVWQRERLPTLRDLEIVGRHAQADGVRIEGAMQPTLHSLLIRRCRHGVHLTNRDRNVLISDCHIYDNSGIGIFLDRLNLHQINITGSHISYCKQGGIRIVACEIRNLQICGNDIEYNFANDNETSADILFDCREGTVREGTIVGNTIQAKFSKNGANIRMIGAKDHPNAVGLFAISGNLIGSQQTNIHLQAARGVTIAGNCIYSGQHHSIHAEDSEHIVIGANTIDHNPEYPGKSTDHIRLERCRNVSLTGAILQHTREPERDDEASVLVKDCQNVNVTGCQILGGRRRGVAIQSSSVVRVADCTIRGGKGDGYRCAVEADPASKQVMAVNNFVGKGGEGAIKMAKETGVESGNLILDA
jgi:polygalacturonase